MDPSNPVTQQYLIAFAVVAVGISGWVLPLKWNLLRLKRSLAKHVSEDTNLKIAKGLGTMLIVFGVLLAFATFQGGAFQ